VREREVRRGVCVSEPDVDAVGRQRTCGRGASTERSSSVADHHDPSGTKGDELDHREPARIAQLVEERLTAGSDDWVQKRRMRTDRRPQQHVS